MKRNKIKDFVENNKFQNFIIGLIIINSITIGFETSEEMMASIGIYLRIIDKTILAVFILEMLIKFYAYRFKFFKSGWNVFDFLIIAVAVLPTSGTFAIFRALRIFRSLRLIKNIPKLRFIVESIFHSLPSLVWIFVLLMLVFYVFAVIGTKLFSSDYPEWFGDIWASMFSLFQIMTLEGWAEISRTIMEKYSMSYIYFVAFILIASYTTLNIFIAIVVNTMSEIQQKSAETSVDKIGDIIQDENEELKQDIRLLKEQIIKLENKLTNR